jgi:hypothetical protein
MYLALSSETEMTPAICTQSWTLFFQMGFIHITNQKIREKGGHIRNHVKALRLYDTSDIT